MLHRPLIFCGVVEELARGEMQHNAIVVIERHVVECGQHPRQRAIEHGDGFGEAALVDQNIAEQLVHPVILRVGAAAFRNPVSPPVKSFSMISA
jgi:hypothetical protein